MLWFWFDIWWLPLIELALLAILIVIGAIDRVHEWCFGSKCDNIADSISNYASVLAEDIESPTLPDKISKKMWCDGSYSDRWVVETTTVKYQPSGHAKLTK